MIKLLPIIQDIREYQRGMLPPNAVAIDTQSPEAIRKKSVPLAVLLCAVLFLCIFLKTRISRTAVIHPTAVIGGVIIGFILLAVHEWLHAVVYPREAQVTVGKVKGKLLFVALASYPLKRRRFILMCLLPYILGIVPLTAFLFSAAENTVFNGLMFGMASMGIVSPYMDVYNVVTVLKYAKADDKIMFYEDGLYRIGRESEGSSRSEIPTRRI